MPDIPFADRAPASARDAACTRIWAVVARIPPGCVATYGQVAALAGLGRRARFTGQALHRAPVTMALPWHRVINAQGRIALPPDSAAHAEQRRRLEAEGVVLRNGRVDLSRHRWQPHRAAPVLD